MTNYQKGYKFEADFVKHLRSLKDIKLAGRYHKSVGPVWKLDYDRLNRFGNWPDKHAPVDTWAISDSGTIFMFQNKSNTMISTEEMLDLIEFAWEMKESISIGLVTKFKNKRKSKSKVWILNNNTVES